MEPSSRRRFWWIAAAVVVAILVILGVQLQRRPVRAPLAVPTVTPVSTVPPSPMPTSLPTSVASPTSDAVRGAIAVSGARAMWLDADTIAWSGAADSTYRLLYDPDGGIEVEAEKTACRFPEPQAPCYVDLKPDGRVAGYAKNPNATGLVRLRTGLTTDNVKFLLRGQVVVAKYQAGGRRLDATWPQIQGVLDDLYAAAAVPQTLGVSYRGAAPTVRVWAPTARSVTLRRYATPSGSESGVHPMAFDPASGVWSVAGDASWDRQFYLLDVEVYVPEQDRIVHNLVTDPYSVSLSQDGAAAGDVRSQFVNLADADLKPAGWDALVKPPLAAAEDIVIYEMHVRDFSINDPTVAAADRGTYRAFTYDGAGPHPNPTLSAGMAHLLKLKDAGLTHVHLMPAFDFASVIEPAAERTEPAVPAAGRDAADQQAAVGAQRSRDGFNWGYDPYHYGVPEGSYSTDPNGVARIVEFREMIAALNRNGLRVVLDVVYNHTAAAGQDDKSVLDKVVPGYYHRYDASGNLYTSSCCADTATEYAMMEKLMVDTVVRFAAEYKVDGFRFDLMNLHTRRNMEKVKAAVQALDPTIYLYGEGWDFGSARDKGLITCPDCYARQTNMTGAGIGLFNDKIRDAAHGGFSTDPVQIRRQGFINGLSYDWNGYEYAGRAQTDLWGAMADLRTALAGSAGFFAGDPQETINYVEKHDNETLFDLNVFRLPNGDGGNAPGWIGLRIPVTAMADRVRSQNLGASLIGLAQGVPFFHMGQDLLRSKSLDRNSYDSGDWFNRVYWDRSRNNFGVGLPPAWDNEIRWGIMRPLLANTRLDPAPADIEAAAAHLREILRLRASSRLFRLPTAADIAERVWFYDSENALPAMIVMALSDAAEPDLDPAVETILVFFNAHKKEQTIVIPGAAGFALHPLQADAIDADPVVQTARFDEKAGAFTIPARTTAAFVSSQPLPRPRPASTLGWVGDMWPAGGSTHRITQAAATGDFEVYVQVYKKDVTEAAGENAAGIVCTLHWGAYDGRP
ncbi:MAG: alpha-1,6-glucosidase domain-containing protein, partial [Anaerolineae bacterium]